MDYFVIFLKKLISALENSIHITGLCCLKVAGSLLHCASVQLQISDGAVTALRSGEYIYNFLVFSG
jgi:hypothetical protein